jgi:hypothetical protein
MARKISDVAGSQDDDVNIIDICFSLNSEGIISNTREVPETETVVLCQFLFFINRKIKIYFQDSNTIDQMDEYKLFPFF